MGIATHILRTHSSENKNWGGLKKGNIPWNKGLKKDDHPSLEKSAKTLSERYSGKEHWWYGRSHSKETIAKMKANPNCGGLRKGSGRGKQGYYKGYWCDSSWELAWIIYSLDHNIIFERNKQGFEYKFENETHKYYPDFILEDGTYVEIKGYMTDQNKAKIEQFNGILRVLCLEEIKKYLEYAVNKFGRNYIELYE